jgi:hypothetical protein
MERELEQRVLEQQEAPPEIQARCPTCAGVARYRSTQRRVLTTRHGEYRLRHRYDHCGACHRGFALLVNGSNWTPKPLRSRCAFGLQSNSARRAAPPRTLIVLSCVLACFALIFLSCCALSPDRIIVFPFIVTGPGCRFGPFIPRDVPGLAPCLHRLTLFSSTRIWLPEKSCFWARSRFTGSFRTRSRRPGCFERAGEIVRGPAWPA